MPAARPVLSSEEWDYLDVDVLRPARSGAVCVTCQHFRYEVGWHSATVLTCPIHQGLIPQGEHVTKRCAQWVARREVATQAGVSATTITRLARPVDDPKAASALTLDLASMIVTVLDCGIEDLLEVVDY